MIIFFDVCGLFFDLFACCLIFFAFTSTFAWCEQNPLCSFTLIELECELFSLIFVAAQYERSLALSLNTIESNIYRFRGNVNGTLNAARRTSGRCDVGTVLSNVPDWGCGELCTPLGSDPEIILLPSSSDGYLKLKTTSANQATW